ncbi:MAG: ferritin family protein [Desulfuromonadaceae bacterium]|nr:ferritin family protein [Desulfuromonadaceae bacterium]
MNIIECTMQMKKETLAHYERLAEAVTDKELKRLFSLLAAAEDEHVGKLGVLMSNLSKFDVENFDTLDEKMCVYNPHVDPRFLAESLKNDPDAYRQVVREEEDTIDFFDHLSDQAESGQLKRICHLLADKEREHLEMLENIYFFVEEPRTYLEWGEFSNLKSL